MLDKQDLFNIQLATKIVKLPQGEIIIKEFTTAGREQFEMMALKMQDGKAKNMKAKLIAMSCVKEDGNRMFGDDELAKISELPSKITELIFNAVLDLNGMGADALGESEGN